jgi:hypothetical protein
MNGLGPWAPCAKVVESRATLASFESTNSLTSLISITPLNQSPISSVELSSLMVMQPTTSVQQFNPLPSTSVPKPKKIKPTEVRKTCIPSSTSCVLPGKSPLIQTTQVASCKKFKPSGLQNPSTPKYSVAVKRALEGKENKIFF